eukprot:scaffold24762_cov22-Phaeocystis_antarctica.AAC.1
MQATALAVTDEGSHCSARADPSHSGTSTLTARRAPADRFKRDVPALGESPASRVVVCRFVCARVLSACTTFRSARDPTPPHPGVVQ